LSDEEIAAIKKALEEMAEHNKKDLSDCCFIISVFNDSKPVAVLSFSEFINPFYIAL